MFDFLFENVVFKKSHEASFYYVNILNLRFADDIVIQAESVKDLQNLMDKVYENSLNLGLKISIAETEVQVIGKKENRIKISINGTQLKQVENFIYLGGTIFQKGNCTKDVKSI